MKTKKLKPEQYDELKSIKAQIITLLVDKWSTPSVDRSGRGHGEELRRLYARRDEIQASA